MPLRLYVQIELCACRCERDKEAMGEFASALLPFILVQDMENTSHFLLARGRAPVLQQQ